MLWKGKAWLSVMCQWNTFILLISIKSSVLRITDFERKCLDVSTMKPRWGNRGQSCMCVVFNKN